MINEIIKAIRQKYVGTAEEHELLKHLEEDTYGVSQRLTEQIENDRKNAEESLNRQIETYNHLMDGRQIDAAVYYWLSSPESDWNKTEVVLAMKGRGLTSEMLHQITVELQKLEREPTADK